MSRSLKLNELIVGERIIYDGKPIILTDADVANYIEYPSDRRKYVKIPKDE